MNQDLKDAMIVGVDMSKDTFDANEYGEEQVGRFANDKSGIAKFIKLLKKQKKRVVVGLEPSGGYERQLIKALLDAGIEVRFADAFRVRCLAQAHGASAKNDPIDARFVARFIAEVGGRVIQRDETRESLAAILASRRALVEHAQGMMQQAALMEKGCARAALEKLARLARSEAAALERKALALVKADPALNALSKRLQTGPGCGPIVAMTLIAEMPELGALRGKEIARLAGLAPFIRKSGKWEGVAKITGGRAVPRNILYMAAMAAKQCDPTLKAFFDRLVAAGKQKMVALVAVMRKLLIAFNAIVRDGTEWDPKKIACRA
jgi:transposase